MHFAHKISCKPNPGLTLKTFPVMIAFLFITIHASTAQLFDDFSDGEFLDNPAWSGTSNHFIVNTAFQLQLNASAAGTSWLSTKFPLDLTTPIEWSFAIKLSFAPSGANFSRYYLMSDQQDLSGALNGYFLQFGESGSGDAVELFRQTGMTITSVCRAKSAAIATAFGISVKVTRTTSGNWEIHADYSGGVDYTLEASGSDASFQLPSYSGIVCVYTITNASRFLFDDIAIRNIELPDTPASGEPVDFRDVIIQEIFADPSPQVGLPDVEYVELYNRSDKVVDTDGWILSDHTTFARLPHKVLLPGDYALVTSLAGSTKFSPVVNVVGVSSFPSLNNTGDLIMLRNGVGQLIDSVVYSDRWYRDEERAEGGWSLELIDPENICADKENWNASEAPSGGTPGEQNSVYATKPDNTGPALMAVIPLDSITLSIVFNEKLQDAVPIAEQFKIDPPVEIRSTGFKDPSRKALSLILSRALEPGIKYSLTAMDIYDCPGNLLQDEFSIATFILPAKSAPGDIIVNEVLFNPRPTGVDFVELFNRSKKVIDLKNWSIRNSLTSASRSETIIALDNLLISPGEFRVFTPDGNTLQGEYVAAVGNAISKTELPPLNDEEGSVALFNGDGVMIDSMRYTDKMHSLFVRDPEGISLERVSAKALSTESSNWRSASSNSGFATPGFANSNSRPDVASDEEVTIEPEIIQPEVFREDFAQIKYSFDRGGLLANIRIADPQGRTIRWIAANALLGAEGFFRWEGDMEDGSPARTGYYMVWFEVFDADGNVKTYRKRVVVF